MVRAVQTNQIRARPKSPRTRPAAIGYFHGFSRPRDQLPPDQITVSTRQKAWTKSMNK